MLCGDGESTAGLSGLGILSVIGIVIFRYRNGRKKQKEME